VVSDKTNALPLWLLVATIALSVTRFGYYVYAKSNPSTEPERVKWQQFKEAKDKVLSSKKHVAMLFVHEGECLQCKTMENNLQREDVADVIVKNYLPVRVVVPRLKPPVVGVTRKPTEADELRENYSVWNLPNLVIVPPEMWEVSLGYDKYSLPDTGFGTFRQIDSRSLKGLLERNVRWHPEVYMYGKVDWVKPDIALKECTNQKPALLFFSRSLDRHCDNVRSKVFGDKAINKMVNEHFLPTFIVSGVRKGVPDTQETKDLIARFHIKSYPTIIISSPAKPSQVLTGFAGEKETIEFLTQAREN